MRRSKRKCNSKYGSPTAPCEPPTKNSKRDTGLKGRSSLLGNEKDIDLLFRISLMWMIPHVWVKIIPTDTDDIENFAFAIGQKWEIILPLLLKMKFLYRYKDSIQISVDKFKDLEREDFNGIKINVGSSHAKGEKLVYYICCNKPVFETPYLQNKHSYKYAYLPYHDKLDQMLRVTITNIIESDKEVEAPLPALCHRATIKCCLSISIHAVMWIVR